MGMPLTHRRFTVDEYFRMAETGILTEADRVELLDGEIVNKVTINPPHAGCVKRTARLLHTVCGDAVIVGVQDPIVLGNHSAPEPDISVLRRHADWYGSHHPRATDVLLVIEVADQSLAHDRAHKLPLYARAGIAEAWLVNLRDDVIEVYREPRAGDYAVRQVVRRADALTPLNLPPFVVRAADILG